MVDIIYETERIRKIYLSLLVINFNKLKKISQLFNLHKKIDICNNDNISSIL